MVGQYLGHLPEGDPLHQYLRYEIQPQLAAVPGRTVYRVFRLHASNEVYLYEEKHTRARMVGKFFLNARERNREAAARRLEREFSNLVRMRQYGFTGYPHYVVRPLGRNSFLNELLVEEYCEGELLSSVINRAIRTRDDGLLFGKLTALGYFLATFHNRSAESGTRVNFDESCQYLESVIARLQRSGCIDGGGGDELRRLRERWRERPEMWSDCRTLVHGDATPENFMFGGGLGVISYDLERLRSSDRVFDVGRMAGELKHFFLMETGNKYAAEPFIGHFLWEYSCHFPDRERTFQAISRRVPFYMGCTLLRIARNSWLAWEYRKLLIREAELCLGSGLR